MSIRLTLIAAALLASSICMPAVAAEVTVTGDGVSFTYDPNTFLIGPQANNTSASFLQNTLVAQAGGSSAPGTNSTGSSVTFTISLTQPGEQFSDAVLTEHGSYTLSGPNSSVSTAGSTFTVTAVGSNLSSSSAIVPDAPPNINDGASHTWTGTSTDDLSGSDWANVRELKVTITNLMTASAAPGSSASIGAGFAGVGSQGDSVSVGVSPVPLPGSLVLLAGGLATLCALGFLRRHRLPLALG
jgi:hypothetical protein